MQWQPLISASPQSAPVGWGGPSFRGFAPPIPPGWHRGACTRHPAQTTEYHPNLGVAKHSTRTGRSHRRADHEPTPRPGFGVISVGQHDVVWPQVQPRQGLAAMSVRELHVFPPARAKIPLSMETSRGPRATRSLNRAPIRRTSRKRLFTAVPMPWDRNH